MLLTKINELGYLQRNSSGLLNISLADHKNVEGKRHMVRNLGFFRQLSDVLIKKVTVWIFDKCEEITLRLRRPVALLEAGRKCLMGPRCHPEYSKGSLLCLWDLLFCGLLHVEWKICAWSIQCPLTRRVCFFFWCMWLKVVPDALITILKICNWKDRALLKLSSLFSVVVFSLLNKRKKKTLPGLLSGFSITPFFIPSSLSHVNRNFS